MFVFDDGKGGVCWNWATGEKHTFRAGEEGIYTPAVRRRDPGAERREREEREAVARVCADIAKTSQQAQHPYLARKGFPEELGLVHEAPWRHFPHGPLGEALTRAMPQGDGPWLIVPGRIGQRVTTVQFIAPDGSKKNILNGVMGAASHRIATGRETWVGDTSIIIRTASGKAKLWYRHNGEGRHIRPFNGLPIDVLGGGFTIAPPSWREDIGEAYSFIKGGLSDIANLPGIQPGAMGEIAAPVVTAIPAGNKYINGFFSVGGLRRSTLVLGELDDAPAAVWRFGGQIAKLARALGDPFRQYLKISLLGDSITWGQTLPENGADTPRDATGSDARNLYNTASWANELKRWIGKQYADGAAPVLSNWPASPSGESIATFSRTDGVFPAGPKFAVTITGGSFTQQVLYNAAYPYGAQHRFTDGSGGTSSGKYAFKMTGKEFTFCFAALSTGCLDYTVWVNGLQLGGVYSTTLGEDGNTAITRRHHALPGYTVDADIEIRTVNNAGAGATQSLYTYAIEFRRQIVISNQGINGTSFMTYRNNMLTSGGFGDGLAVDAEDGFIFIQLGTNDRGKRPDLSYTLSEARGHAQALIDTVKTLSPTAKLIMMCANRPTLDGPPDFKCTMGDIRQMLLETAQDNTLDLIDNYAPFVRADAGKFLADGLHPNRPGHGLMARNIINAVRGM
ncbi:GDSL-type esterase/lipase family protein [Gemmobacter sp. 24YEA27]|uniref:GDSL-type esterase/lipase family protein n=1 Tax=Gemmobacter sp. 24YEA27 TaxID=3040672 RepID=UPI0024B34081|nr:GDSL-type esterase/lipase family protein [Gemmobacter sp. 24YEA27]